MWPVTLPLSIPGVGSKLFFRGAVADSTSSLMSVRVPSVRVFYESVFLKMFFVVARYKRVFSIGTKGITTYNPNNVEVTNQVSAKAEAPAVIT